MPKKNSKKVDVEVEVSLKTYKGLDWIAKKAGTNIDTVANVLLAAWLHQVKNEAKPKTRKRLRR